MGWFGVALLVAMLALFVGGLWLGSLRPAPREPQDPFVVVPMPRENSLTPRQVVVMDVCDDGVFRAS